MLSAGVFLPNSLIETAQSFPSKGFTFISSKDKKLVSYADLQVSVARTAAALAQLGVKKGERICLLLTEQHEFVVAFLATLHLGAVAVPIAPPASIGDKHAYFLHMRHVIECSDPALLVTTSALQGTLREIVTGVPVTSFQDLPCSSHELEVASLASDDLALLQFTSGSTARPKGVMISHGNLAVNTRCILSNLKLTSDDVSCSWLPFFHDMGLIGFMLTPIVGSLSGVFMSPTSFLKRPAEWLRMISDYRGSYSFAPNFAYALCLKRIGDEELTSFDLSCWRVAGCGSEPIDPRVLRHFAERFSACQFKEEHLVPAYGMAESTLAISFPTLAQPPASVTVDFELLSTERMASPPIGQRAIAEIISCGRVFEDHDVRVVDDEGRLLPDRMVGEICLRGPSVTNGYFRNEEATNAALNNGWLRTGDLGFLIDGNIYVCGRKKELVIVGGRKFHPTDIEWCAAQSLSGSVGRIIAFGVSDAERGTEKLILAIETKDPLERHSDMLRLARAAVLEKLEVRVDEIVFVARGSLPKTSSGKLQRAKTRELFLAGQLEKVSAAADLSGITAKAPIEALQVESV